MVKKGDNIEVLFEKTRGGDIELLEGLSQQTAVKSLSANNRKFIPTRKKRGGCNGGDTFKLCLAKHHCSGHGRCRLPANHDGDHICEINNVPF